MHLRRLRALSPVAVVACCITVLIAATASANEIQLAGIRLGQHALNLFQVYGQPDGIVEGQSEALTPAAGAGAGAGGAQAGPQGGMEGGMGGGIPGVGTADEMAGMGPGGTAGMMMGMVQGLLGGGQAAPQQAAGAAPAAGGAAGGRPPSPNPFFRSSIPDWASPVWVRLWADETLWVYRRGAVVLGFVLDRDGYIVAICVAGEKCDWARTAMWDPKRTVKLGDNFRTVINRYGYPTRTDVYNRVDRTWASNFPPSTVDSAFGGIQHAYRDLILHYGHNDNIEFLLRDMEVIRIHIWEPEARPPEPRLEEAGVAGAGGMGGMGGEGGPGMGAGGGPGMGGPGMGAPQ